MITKYVRYFLFALAFVCASSQQLMLAMMVPCPLCGKELRPNSVKGHIKNVCPKNITKQRSVCPDCGKTYAGNSSLNKHQRTCSQRLSKSHKMTQQKKEQKKLKKTVLKLASPLLSNTRNRNIVSNDQVENVSWISRECNIENAIQPMPAQETVATNVPQNLPRESLEESVERLKRELPLFINQEQINPMEGISQDQESNLQKTDWYIESEIMNPFGLSEMPDQEFTEFIE